MCDFAVFLVSELVNRKEPLVRIEGEVPRIVVGKVPRFRSVANDEELDEAQQRLGVSVSGVVLVINNLLHCPPRADPKRLQFDLHDGDAIDQEHDVVAVMAAVRIDAELIDDLKVVLAPVRDVN